MTKSLMVTTTKKNYELVDEGQVQAVLADVDRVPDVETQWGTKDIIRFYWLTSQLGTKEENDGQMLPIFQRFNASLHEKATLRKAISKILGYDPGEEYDIGALIGMNAILIIEHNEKEGKTYSNVAGQGTAILKLPKGATKLGIPDSFKGWQQQQKQDAGGKPGSARKNPAEGL